MKNTERRYKKCPTCHSKSYITDWRPEAGLDPELRQFHCVLCELEWHERIPLDEQGGYEE